MPKYVVLVAALLLAVLVHGPVSAQVETGQDISRDRVVDHGYLFELGRPGPAWLLGGQNVAGRYAGNALASAVNESVGVLLVVHAWPSGAVDYEGIAASLLEDFPTDDFEVETSEAITFAALPAWRLQVTAWVEDTSFRISYTAVAHRGFLYLLRAAGPSDFTATDGATFEPILSQFAFLEGESVPGRPDEPRVADTVGVGWRVSGGVYENAAYGVRVDPGSTGWRLCVGDELVAINPDAEVGLCSDSPEATVIFIAERVGGVDLEAFANELRAVFAEDVIGGGVQNEPVEEQPPGDEPADGASAEDVDEETAENEALAGEMSVEIAGQTTALTRYHVEDVGERTEFVHGVFMHDDNAVQVVGWWPVSGSETIAAQLPEVLAGIHFIDEPLRQTLAARLTVAEDPQNTVGETFALRDGCYRNYEYDYVWTKPAGFWRIATGALAEELYADADLFVDHQVAGLTGMVIVESLADLDAAAYHQAVLEWMLAPENPALSETPEQRTVNGAELRATWVEGELDGFVQRFLITTTAVDDRRFQIIVWGLPEVVTADEAGAWRVVEGLEVAAEDLQPSATAGGQLTDDRLGFSLRAPAADWQVEDLTQAVYAELASFVRTSPGEGRGIAVFAANASSSDQDENWFLELARETALARLRDMTVLSVVSERLAGLPARRFTGDLPGGGAVEIYLLRRGMTYFAVVAYDETGQGPPVAELVDAFGLVD